MGGVGGGGEGGEEGCMFRDQRLTMYCHTPSVIALPPPSRRDQVLGGLRKQRVWGSMTADGVGGWGGGGGGGGGRICSWTRDLPYTVTLSVMVLVFFTVP